jgi:hypothetical protein
MAEYYGYFNGVEYDEDFVALVNSILVQNGVFGNGLIVSAGSGMTVNVAQGAAIIDGFIYYNDSPMALVIPTANASLPRIDSVMLRWNIPNRTMNLIVVSGTAQSNPTAPAPVRNGTYYDFQIATVYVGAGVSGITAANITDTRPNSEVCGITSGYNSVDIDAMMAQYTAQFNEWFEQMKGQLTTDAAGNLQTQINSIDNQLNTQSLTSGTLPQWNGSQLVNGVAVSSVVSPNLLINPGFSINQRGQSSYSSTNQYTVDRWMLLSGSVSNAGSDNGITLSSASVCQFIEGMAQLSGATLTLSASINGATQKISGVLSTSAVSGNGLSFVWTSTGYIKVTITGNGSLSWAKLELGSTNTPYFPPDPSSELLKCQRYYYRIAEGNGTSFHAAIGGVQGIGANIYFPFSVPSAMRALPTLSFSGVHVWNGSSGEMTPNNIIIQASDITNKLYTITTQVSGATGGAAYTLLINSDDGAYMVFDAEITS